MSDLLQSASILLTVLTPLVAVPLTVITFYLRSLREHQLSRHADLARRTEQIELGFVEIQRQIKDFERDYATKEEWLRECMHARSRLDQLADGAVRMETLLQTSHLTPVATRGGAQDSIDGVSLPRHSTQHPISEEQGGN